MFGFATGARGFSCATKTIEHKEAKRVCNRYLVRMRLSWPEAQRETNRAILTFSEAAFAKQLYELLKSTIGLNFRQIGDVI